MTTKLKGPSFSYFKNLIVTEKTVEIKLLNGDLLSGKIIWNDDYAILLEQEDNKELMILINAIAYLNKKT